MVTINNRSWVFLVCFFFSVVCFVVLDIHGYSLAINTNFITEFFQH